MNTSLSTTALAPHSLSDVGAVILAAGKGTRMNARRKNKVAYNLGGKPMILHTVQNLRSAGVGQIIVVVGYQADSIKKALGDTVDYAVQKTQLGTGDALSSALSSLNPGIKTVLSVYGDDSAFYPPALYQEMVSKQQEHNVPLLFLSIHKDDPSGLGRIVRESGRVVRIVEEKNTTPEEKKIQEINTGFYCFEKQFLLEFINRIQKNPVSGEYYLTDLVELALQAGRGVEALFLQDSTIWHGVNNKRDYAKAQRKIRE